MISRFVMAAGLAVALVTPAFAGKCADAIAKVGMALETAQVNDNEKATVDDLIKLAQQKQTAGDAKGCLMDLAEAKKLLNIK